MNSPVTLNHYLLCRTHGGTLSGVGQVAFGNLGTTGLLSNAALTRPPRLRRRRFSLQEKRHVASAVTRVMREEQISAAALLADDGFGHRLVAYAEKQGLRASTAEIRQEFLQLLTNPSWYAARGIVIDHADDVEYLGDLLMPQDHVAEVALVGLHYRTGWPIAPILADPHISRAYLSLTKSMAPEMAAHQSFVAALRVMRMRAPAKASAHITAVEDARDEILRSVSVPWRDYTEIQHGRGLLEVLENDRYVYVAAVANAQASAKQICGGTMLDVMSGRFWKPDQDAMQVRFTEDQDGSSRSIAMLEAVKLARHNPFLNWPVH